MHWLIFQMLTLNSKITNNVSFRALNSGCKIDPACFTGWMSFLQYNDGGNPNPETFSAGISKFFHNDRIAEKAKMIYK